MKHIKEYEELTDFSIDAFNIGSKIRLNYHTDIDEDERKRAIAQFIEILHHAGIIIELLHRDLDEVTATYEEVYRALPEADEDNLMSLFIPADDHRQEEFDIQVYVDDSPGFFLNWDKNKGLYIID